MAAAADDDEKSTFRCLDAARWVVAAVVMVVIVAVIGYAFKVVLRPSDLSLWIVNGSVSVKRSPSNSSTTSTSSSSSHELTFKYTVRAVNPSGRVWIYYTGITAKLKAINSTGEDNSIFILNLADVTLAPQSQTDTVFTKTTYAGYPYQEEYFEKLDNGTNIDRGWIELGGTRTVEAYSGYNTTPVASSYYCSPIVIGGDDDDGTAVAVQLDAACNIVTNRSTRGG